MTHTKDELLQQAEEALRRLSNERFVAQFRNTPAYKKLFKKVDATLAALEKRKDK